MQVARQAGLPFFGRMPSLAREIEDFGRDVIERSRVQPVLAEFWAPWAGTCVAARERIEALTRQVPGLVHVSINVEMHPEVITDHGVHGLPLVKLYGGGLALGEIAGLLPVAQMLGWLTVLLAEAKLQLPPAAEPAPAAEVPKPQ